MSGTMRPDMLPECELHKIESKRCTIKYDTGQFIRRDDCRVCKSKNVSVFLDYGDMPLAGDFRLESELSATKVYPLDLAVCLDCSLVQVLNVVSPDVLFGDYRYLSSVTHTLSQHFRDYARLLKERVLPANDPFVVEIGCNDGVLLEPLKALGVRVLGVDAAPNVGEVARKRDLDVITGFFGETVAARVLEDYGPADVVTASNVFAHIDDLDEVLVGVDMLLKPNGTFAVEVHYVLDLLQTFQFDTVYHEHLCYYSLQALEHLYKRFGFKIVNVQRLPMHGGAIRVLAKRTTAVSGKCNVAADMMRTERDVGITDRLVYENFGRKVERYRDRLRDFLLRRKSDGRTLSAYGAAGRATTMLNYCRLDSAILDYVVDESPFRYGRFVPGVRIPIVPREKFHQIPTNDCLITAWNYKDEIVSKEKAYLDGGGIFITPLPEMTLIQKI